MYDSLPKAPASRSEEHTSELQSRLHLGCRLLLGKKSYVPPRVRHRPASGRGQWRGGWRRRPGLQRTPLPAPPQAPPSLCVSLFFYFLIGAPPPTPLPLPPPPPLPAA